MIRFFAACLLLALPNVVLCQPLAGLPSTKRLANMSPRNLEASMSPLFDGGRAAPNPTPVEASGGAPEDREALAAANLASAGESERSLRSRPAPPPPVAVLPGTTRALEALGGVVPYVADKAEEAGKKVDAEGERRAREGAQRQREMEEQVTGQKSNKYPQYPDRTAEERSKDNGRYPKFEN